MFPPKKNPMPAGAPTASKFPLSLKGLDTMPQQQPKMADPKQAQPHAATPETTPAAYMGPDQGPFECDDCQFYTDPNQCAKPQVLAEVGPSDENPKMAKVDPQGCCNFFKKAGQQQTTNTPARTT